MIIVLGLPLVAEPAVVTHAQLWYGTIDTHASAHTYAASTHSSSSSSSALGFKNATFAFASFMNYIRIHLNTHHTPWSNFSWRQYCSLWFRSSSLYIFHLSYAPKKLLMKYHWKKSKSRSNVNATALHTNVWERNTQKSNIFIFNVLFCCVLFVWFCFYQSVCNLVLLFYCNYRKRNK